MNNTMNTTPSDWREPATVQEVVDRLEAGESATDLLLVAAEIIRAAYRDAGIDPRDTELGMGAA